MYQEIGGRSVARKFSSKVSITTLDDHGTQNLVTGQGVRWDRIRQ